jgi:hypothetical protein
MTGLGRAVFVCTGLESGGNTPCGAGIDGDPGVFVLLGANFEGAFGVEADWRMGLDDVGSVFTGLSVDGDPPDGTGAEVDAVAFGLPAGE